MLVSTGTLLVAATVVYSTCSTVAHATIVVRQFVLLLQRGLGNSRQANYLKRPNKIVVLEKLYLKTTAA